MRVASGPDEDGSFRYCQTVRACSARSEGVTTVNQWLTLRNREAGLQSGGYGTGMQCTTIASGWSTPKPFSSNGEEAMVNVCGVAVAMLPEYSWAPH